MNRNSATNRFRFAGRAFVSATGPAGSAAGAETLLERGTYLARSIVAFGNCHTPKRPEGEVPGMELAGMAPMFVLPQYTANAPNITSDKTTGTGGWTDQQIALAIREGTRRR